MADLTAERIHHNNQVFRDANEAIHEAAQRHDHEVERIPFLCECPTEDCAQIVPLTEVEYTAVRANSDRYVIAVGHESAEQPVGQVVERHEGYIVVEKS